MHAVPWSWRSWFLSSSNHHSVGKWHHYPTSNQRKVLLTLSQPPSLFHQAVETCTCTHMTRTRSKHIDFISSVSHYTYTSCCLTTTAWEPSALLTCLTSCCLSTAPGDGAAGLVGCLCAGVRDVGAGTRAVLDCCGPLVGAASLEYDNKLACMEIKFNPFSLK